MTRLKAFIPDLEIIETDKFRFLSNTQKNDVPHIMRVFKDVCAGLPQPCHGATEQELREAGILGLYETQ